MGNSSPSIRKGGLPFSFCRTPTRRTRAGWTASGACTSGSTARHAGATRPASGSAAMTSTEGSRDGSRADGDTRARRRILGRRGPADERDGHGRCDPTRLVRVLCCPVGADDCGDDAAERSPGSLETRSCQGLSKLCSVRHPFRRFSNRLIYTILKSPLAGLRRFARRRICGLGVQGLDPIVVSPAAIWGELKKRIFTHARLA